MQNEQAVRDVLAAGLAWLFETEQPDGAIESHHGPGHAAGERMRIAFAPLPNPVVIIDVQDRRYDETLYDRPLINPLTAVECDGVAGLLKDLGRTPIDRWNGAGCETGSFRLAGPIHPTLEAARQRCHAGCPDHAGPLCSWDGCPWYRTGHDLMVPPNWSSLEPARLPS